MNREIEFRGWSIALTVEGWVYGGLYRNVHNNNYIYSPEYGDVKVDPATVGQYTGFDDGMGRKVYEGDVYATDGSTYAVVFRHGAWCWASTDERFETWATVNDPFYMRIFIGTIHRPEKQDDA